MKKTIFNALKAKFVGVSDSILNRIATGLARTVTSEEQVDAAVEAVTIQDLLENYGDYRATSAVESYAARRGLKDGKPVENGGAPEQKKAEPAENPNENNGGDGGTVVEVPAWAKSLFESSEKLSKRMDAIDRARTMEDRRNRLTNVIAKLPETLRKGYERIELGGTEDEFQQTLVDVQSEVDAIVKENQQRGAAFGVPAYKAAGSGSSPKEATAEEAAALVEKMQI